MKRLVTTGIFGTILGIVGAGTANASIVSSGFLDEKLTEMTTATTLQLDTKANQSDLTALSNKIGTLPSAIAFSAWTAIPYYTEFEVNMPDAGFLLPPTLGEQLELLFSDGNSPIDRMFRVITLAGDAFPVGTIDPGSGDPQAEFLGLKPLTQKVRSIDAKIGTLPEGITVQGMYDGWTDGLYTFPGLFSLSGDAMKFSNIFGTSVGSLLSNGRPEFTNKEYTGPIYPLWKLSQGIDQIGTLPSGNFPMFPGSESLFPGIKQPHTYPTSLAELIIAIYGDGKLGRAGLLTGIITGFPLYGTDEYLGIIPNYQLAKDAHDKIGTVPDGKNLAGMISETDAKIGTLPAGYDSVGAALSAIKGIAEDAKTAALAAIPDPKQEGSSGKYVLTVDIVGDNATYHWEKIDREGEATTTE